jgi:hypothetical protein
MRARSRHQAHGNQTGSGRTGIVARRADLLRIGGVGASTRLPLKLAELLATALTALLVFGAAAALAATTVSIDSAQLSGQASVNVTGTITPQPEPAFIEYGFEYAPNGSTSWTLFGAGLIFPEEAEAGAAIPVQAEENLEPGTEYAFRLHVENFETHEAVTSEPDLTVAIPSIAPTIASTFVSGVTASSATLDAKIRPGGASTTYHFQYISDAAYKGDGEEFGAGTVETPESSSIGSDNHEHLASASITGLTPSAPYDFRAIARNGVETVEGAAVAFRTFPRPETKTQTCPNAVPRVGPSAALPDCRAYEQVSPVNKNGTDVFGEIGQSEASPSGDAITYYSLAPLPTVAGASEVNGASEFPSYLASRGPADWSTQGLLPPTEPGSQAVLSGWTEDLSDFIVNVGGGEESTPGGAGAYLRPASGGTYQRIPGARAAFIDDATPDDSQILFESSSLELVPGIRDENELPFLYEWHDGKVEFVGYLPESEGGGAPEEGSAAGGGQGSYKQGTISEDGSRIFFTDLENGRVYMRNTATKMTVPVSGGSATWRAATPNGASVFYTEREQLFRFDSVSEQREELTAPGSEVLGTVGISADGTYVYFAAHADLATDAVAGQNNLYLWHKGSITFIAAVGPVSKAEEGGEHGAGETEEAAAWQSGGIAAEALEGRAKTSRVDPSGKEMLFSSRKAVTSYRVEGNAEYYLFDAERPRGPNNPICVSCNPTGAAVSTGVIPVTTADSRGAPVDSAASALPRSLSEAGNRVFFQTSEALVPQDTNGQEDVYEWEAPGAGSCIEQSSAFVAQDGGCLFLISTGHDPAKSYFDDASADGSSVFFLTRQSLVGQDTDENNDLYVARENGGLATQNPSPATPACDGEACKTAVIASPVLMTSGSAMFTGPGDVAPAVAKPAAKPKKEIVRCAKGKKRSHGKCRKPKPKKRSKAKKSAQTDRRASR